QDQDSARVRVPSPQAPRKRGAFLLFGNGRHGRLARAARPRSMLTSDARVLCCEADMEFSYQSQFESPAGLLVVVASERGIRRLEFAARSREEGLAASSDTGEAPASTQVEIARECRQQLEEHFAAKPRDFTVPLDLRGTAFQLACWRALLAIPYGETRTYADIARAVERPQGFRAVGLANNRNPIAIIVPCHRVIASDGTLCGYGGGPDLKRKLLELEGALAVAQPALIA